MTRRTQPLLALCALFGLACYEYLPARDPGSLIGQRVQVSLTDSGSVVLASKVGPSVEAIEGDLVADSAGSYLVAVSVTRVRVGSETDWRGERVAIAHPLVASLAERRFSRSRSMFAGALMTAGVVGVTVGLRGGGESSGGVPGTGRPPGQ
jgi:hypothetical protein